MIDAILVPRGAEARAVRRALASAKSSIAVAEMGIGSRAAVAAAEALAASEAAKPERVLIAGLAGLLSPALSVGDVLVYAAVAREGAQRISLDRDFADRVARALPRSLTGIVGIESPRIVTSALEKAELARSSGASAVDMESFTAAETLRAHGIATAVLRVGSDARDDDLPNIDRALDGSGGIDGFALLIAMAREPLRGAAMAGHGVRALGVLRRAIRTLAMAAAPVLPVAPAT